MESYCANKEAQGAGSFPSILDPMNPIEVIKDGVKANNIFPFDPLNISMPQMSNYFNQEKLVNMCIYISGYYFEKFMWFLSLHWEIKSSLPLQMRCISLTYQYLLVTDLTTSCYYYC